MKSYNIALLLCTIDSLAYGMSPLVNNGEYILYNASNTKYIVQTDALVNNNNPVQQLVPYDPDRKGTKWKIEKSYFKQDQYRIISLQYPKSKIAQEDKSVYRIYYHTNNGVQTSQLYNTQSEAQKYYDSVSSSYAKILFQNGQTLKKYGGSTWTGKCEKKAKEDFTNQKGKTRITEGWSTNQLYTFKKLDNGTYIIYNHDYKCAVRIVGILISCKKITLHKKNDNTAYSSDLTWYLRGVNAYEGLTENNITEFMGEWVLVASHNQSFSQSITDSITKDKSTTNSSSKDVNVSLTVGMSAKGKMGVPFVASGEVEASVSLKAGFAYNWGQAITERDANTKSKKVTATCAGEPGKIGQLWQFNMKGFGSGGSAIWQTNRFRCTYNKKDVPRCNPIPQCEDGGKCVTGQMCTQGQ